MAVPTTATNLRVDIVGSTPRAAIHGKHHTDMAIAVNALEALILAGRSWQVAPSFQAPNAGDWATAGRISVATVVTAFWAKRTGGTGATVDVKKNGVSLLTTPLSLTGTGWMQGVLVTTPTLAAGDTLEFDIVTVAGGPTEITTTLDGTRIL